MDPVQNASIRFAALSALFDSSSRRHLANRGVAPGWHCLEVGGGSGSIGKWLAERVGPTGRVTVTDIETRFLEHITLPNVEVSCHDITRDPLPACAFDLIHTRMVLMHLPPRDQVLARLRSALKPGGWLVCEEFDRLSAPPDPDLSPGEIILKTHQAMGRVLHDQGVAPQYGRLLFGRLREIGLMGLGAEARLVMVQSGSWSARLLRASYERRRRAMIDAGYVTEEEFDADLAHMEAADFVMPSPLMWSAWGRRPWEGPCANS
jgi:ubiquinone/menaquinone biosynthesis C-methylase UbiE